MSAKAGCDKTWVSMVRKMVTVKAHAKVNLTLEVLGRREDGYHDIVSIMQTIDLRDTLRLEPADTITLHCDRVDLLSPDNLALKAANLLRKVTGCDKGARITLQKEIPVAAGLGGGSSDAAATLQGLNLLWELGLSVDGLMSLAMQLGSDVPFFMRGGTAMASGRGERIRPLPDADLPTMVVLSPAIDIPLKTASIYGKLGQANLRREH